MSCKHALFVSLTAAGIVCAAAVPVSARTLTFPAAPSAPQPATATAAPHPVMNLASLLATARPATYTVQPGDTLTAIAGRLYGNPAAWPVLYWANHRTIRWADIIDAGQQLTVPAAATVIPAAPAQLAPPPPPPPPVTRPAPAYEAPRSAPAYAQPSYAPARSAPADVTADRYQGGVPGGSFGACVVARESGGNAQVMNASGHYGLYQFSASTWAAYGGAPGDFGHASAAEQNGVFATALARGGQSNWSLYDNC